MVTVAKARQLKPDAMLHVEELAAEIVRLARNVNTYETMANTEPLLHWLTTDAASVYRQLEYAVQESLARGKLAPPATDDMDSIGDLTAFFYVALFRTLRRGLASFATSNPTWIRTRVPIEDKLNLDRHAVIYSFIEEISKLSEALQRFSPKLNGCEIIRAKIEQATSSSLPLRASSVDAIVTSPPYCTRIDYAVATLPELRFLGYTDKSLKMLRDQMIGTPTMNNDGSSRLTSGRLHVWGPTITDFLEAVAQHTSKASSTYYLRYFIQYFNAVEISLKEIERVLRPGSPCVLVIQDSYYKEVRLDLAQAYLEMSEALGLDLYKRLDYRNGNSLAYINKGARKYRKSSQAVESVLFLAKN